MRPTWQHAIERLLARVASHVCSQRVATGMRLALATAVDPFARVLLLSSADVVAMDVFNEVVHVAQIARVTAIPAADRHLVAALAAVVIVLATADERDQARGIGDVAGGVGRDRGRGRGRDVLLVDGGHHVGRMGVPGGSAGATTLGRGHVRRGRRLFVLVQLDVLGQVIRSDGGEGGAW